MLSSLSRCCVQHALSAGSGRVCIDIVAPAGDHRGLPWPPRPGPRESGPPPATADLATTREAASPPHPRPHVLGPIGDRLAPVAVGTGPRPTRHGCPLASHLAASAVGAALRTQPRRSPPARSSRRQTRHRHSRHQSVVGAPRASTASSGSWGLRSASARCPDCWRNCLVPRPNRGGPSSRTTSLPWSLWMLNPPGSARPL